MPIIKDFICKTCLDYTDGSTTLHIAYRAKAIFSYSIADIGESCIVDGNIFFSFYDNSNSYPLRTGQQEISLTMSSSTSLTSQNQNENDPAVLTFVINEYSYSDFATSSDVSYISNIRRCLVPIIENEPTFSNMDKTSYASNEATNFPITFTKISNFYSPCFGHNSSYLLYYWSIDNKTEQIGQIYNQNKESILADVGDSESTVGTFDWDISALSINVYYYKIVARNVINESANSTIATLIICSSNSDIILPELKSPVNGAKDVTVEDIPFEWSLDASIQAIRCSAQETAYVVIELESENTYNAALGPQSSLSTFSVQTTRTTIRSTLLPLSTRYYWRITVFHEKPNEIDSTVKDISIYSSSINTFVTVSKHCAYVDCHNGICNSASVTCKCYSDYRGKYCDVSGLTGSEIGLIVCSVIILLIIILIIVFIILKRRGPIFGLKLPDLSKYMFIMPKSFTDEANASAQVPLSDIENQIAQDPQNEFKFAIDLLEHTSITESDNICLALIYAYEHNGTSLSLLLQLIKYEVATATSSETLFRSNSFATKCFKYYSRMIGLPYLFRALSPLLNKLITDEQKSNLDISLSGNAEFFDGIDIKDLTVTNYELNSEKFSFSFHFRLELKILMFLQIVLQFN